MAKISRARAPVRVKHAKKKVRAKRATKKVRAMKKVRVKPTQAKPTKPERVSKKPKTKSNVSVAISVKSAGRKKRQYTPELLENCRHRFEETTQSLETIALACRISTRTVGRLAQQHAWVRYSPEPLDVPAVTRLRERAAALVEAVQGKADILSTATVNPNLSPGEKEKAAEMGTAIARAIGEILSGLEEELATIRALRARMRNEPQSTLDAQRAAQTYASLNATLRDIQHAQYALQPKQDSSEINDYDDFPADIDEFRNELARRIDAFVASRTEPEDARGDAAPPVAEV